VIRYFANLGFEITYLLVMFNDSTHIYIARKKYSQILLSQSLLLQIFTGLSLIHVYLLLFKFLFNTPYRQATEIYLIIIDEERRR